MSTKEDSIMGGGNMQEVGDGNRGDGLAPSERHLEDHLWAHPGALGTLDFMEGANFRQVPSYSMLMRQVRIPAGIMDLVGINDKLRIVELKRGTITAQSFTQVMRYTRDIRFLMEKCIDRYIALELPLYEDVMRRWQGDGFYTNDLIGATLIGHAYENENLLIACAACDVDVYIYDYRDGRYTFQEVDTPKVYQSPAWDQLMALRDKKLGGHLIGFLAEHVATYGNIQFDAIDAANEYLSRAPGGAK